MAIAKEGASVITISEKGFGKRTDLDQFRMQSRAGKGIKAGNCNEKTGLLVNMKLVEESDDIILIADNGTMIRIKASQVSNIGRNTKGVTIMKLKGDAKVVAMAITMHDDEADFDEVEIDEEALREARAEASVASAEESEAAEETAEENSEE